MHNLVGPLLPLLSLSCEYKETPFYSSILSLCMEYREIRRIERDGNCFYTAVLYLLVSCDRAAVLDRLNKSLLLNDQLHIEPYIINEFLDPLLSFFGSDASDDPINTSLDIDFFNYSIMYLRIVTSLVIRRSARFKECIADVNGYCKTHVEVNNEYAGEVEIEGLMEGLNLQIDIICIEKGNIHRYVRGTGLPIGTLLYMPDHFDIIYK